MGPDDKTESGDRPESESPKGLAALIPERKSEIEQIEIPELQLPKGGGALRGIDEKFAINGSNGTATLTVQIPLTPNRNGHTPKLSLNYSSGAGNGAFGMGWSLSLPAIQRKTDKRLPRYLAAPDEDVFMIAGAEDLVPQLREIAPGEWEAVDDTAGAYRVRAYRPRIAGDFARIERIEHPLHGEYWKVTDRCNSVTIYGRSAEARIADPSDARRISHWLPELAYDDKGSWIAYEYKAENDDEMPATAAEANRRSGLAPFVNLYPKRVRYGNRSAWFTDPASPYDPASPVLDHHFEIVFDYGEHDDAVPLPEESAGRTWPYRADAFSSYRTGFEIRTARLCRRILLFHHFPDEDLGADALIRSLDLSYAPATVNGAGQAAAVHLVGIEQAGYVRLGDGTYSRKAIPPLSFDYNEVEWDQTVRIADPEALVDAPIGLSPPYQFVDLFGEGIAGILSESGGAWIYKHNRSDAAAAGELMFDRGRIIDPKPNFTGLNEGAVTLQDLEASGEKQIVLEAPQVGGYFALNADEEWETFRAFDRSINIDLRDPTVKRIDLTGEGRLAIVVAEDQAFLWYPSDGKKGFKPPERALRALDEERGPAILFAEARQSIFLADLNGDGLTDIVRIRNGDISYWPNLGWGLFGAKISMSGAPLFDSPDRFDPTKLRLADLTGNGAADLLYVGGEKVRAWLNAAGNGWSEATDLDSLPPIAITDNIQIADLMGQGTPCLIWSSTLPDTARSPLRYVDLMGGRKPHLLVRYVNNMGKETRLEYRSSTHFYLADKEAGTPWVTRLPFPVQVVSRQLLDDHVTGARLSSLYSFHHGYWDSEEREFRGFGRVDRVDTEDFEQWRLSGPATLEEARDLYQAPMLTRTWYHVGAWDRHERLLSQFEKEYWQAAYERAFPTAPALEPEPGLPEAAIVAAPTISDAQFLTRLSAAERREAARACKGLVVRQEVFALDAAPGAGEAELRRQMTPYTVDTHSCHIQFLQPRGPNPNAVLVVAEDEGLKISYERRPEDPRVEHAVNLVIDELGNVLEKANISYGRDPALAAAAVEALADSASDFAAFSDSSQLQSALADALSRAEATQSRTQLLVTRNRFTNDIDLASTWRSRLPSETETFEINGLFPADRLFARGELASILSDARSTEIAFEAAPGAGVSRRRIEHQRTYYYDETVEAALPLGEMASHGLVFQGLACAFTPSLLADRFGPRIADPEAEMTPGGYVHSEGDDRWWIPTGTVRYSEPGDDLADVRARFFKPVAHEDAFGAETLVTYHKDYFLLIETLTDAVGNVSRVESYDFRLLGPVALRDPNDNLTAIVADELGLVKAEAFLGKDLDGDGIPELERADNLSSLSPESGPEAATVAALVAASDSTVIEPLARQLLAEASVRFAYDLNSWKDRSEPVVAVRIARERHHEEDRTPPIHVAFDYTDGSGALAMVKTQAEPGIARSATLEADGSVTLTEVDTAALSPPRMRWVGTGRLVLNNKGKPVRRYEPYFAATPRFETLPEMVESGVTAILTYDAPGRLIRTDLPDGTFLRSEFDSWEALTFDPGDTVLDSRWHEERVDRLIDAELIARGSDPAREAEAAVQAEAYADTPARTLIDSLGRPILSIDHEGFDLASKAILLTTTIVLDVEGNVLEVIDARGNRPAAFDHDMVGRRIAERNMDSGSRWCLPTVSGNPLVKWDQRDHVARHGYDALQRPVSLHVSGGDGPSPLDHLVMVAQYGEGQANDRRDGLRTRLYRRWDGGGRQQFSAYDGKGNLLESVRRFAADYRGTPDWSGDLEAPLEVEAHSTRHSYDAVNRIVSTTLADGSRIENKYSPANLLETVQAFVPGRPAETIVAAIDYDARGQRRRIDYGNGSSTAYRHDPKTFRLIGCTTVKSDGSLAQDLDYTHDCAGNLTHQEDRAIPAVFFDNSKIVALTRYSYDPLYRLVESEGREHSGQQANGNFGPEDNWRDDAYMVGLQPGDAMAWRPYSQSYDYDAVGNIRRLSHAAGAGSYTRLYSYEAATNRLISTSIGAETYPCDHHPEHGFIRSMPHLPVMEFTFRDEMRASARQSVAAGTPETTYYVYDHDGRRIRKVTDAGAAAGADPAIKEERLYVGALEIYRNHSGAAAGLERLTVSVLDGASRAAMLERRNAVDDGSPAAISRYQLSNHLGSSVMELDSSGRTISYEEYHPYGTTAYQATDTTIAAAPKRYRYCGMERDEESGLSNHNARYYCPWLARWIKPDPGGLKDGINDYAYVSGNPIRLADPSGRDGWDRFMGGVKMVGGALETFAGGTLFVAGVATSEFGVGVLLMGAGAVVTAHGADVTVSGGRTMWNGEQVDTVTSSALQEYGGLTRTQANLADATISVVGSLGSSAVTRAPAVVSAATSTADEAITAAPAVVEAASPAATTAASSADEVVNSVTLAFRPGLPTGHNMVGVTTGGTTQWSHLVVESVDEVSGGLSTVASPGTRALVVSSSSGPSASYLTATVPVTQAEAQAARAMMSLAESGGGSAGAYSYLGNNCTTYATSVLREAGVVAPNASTPGSAFLITAMQSPAIVEPLAVAGATLSTARGVDTIVRSTPPPQASVSMAPAASYSSAPAEPAYSAPVRSSEEAPVCSSEQPAAEAYYDTEEQVCRAE